MSRREKIFRAGASIFYLLAIFLLIVILGLGCFFDNLTFEQICFHIKYAKEIMTLKGEYIVVFSFAVALFLVGAVVLYWLMKKLGTCVFVCGSLILFTVTFLWGSLKYDFFSYVRGQFEYSDFYEKNYQQPKLKDFTVNSSSKNVVILFLESMEAGYGDVLLKNLSSLNRSMGKHYQIYGSNWTTAGMVTALCGVPLDVDVAYNQYDNRYKFLPNLVCLPDILKHLKYDNYFIYGGSSQFGGVDAFLSQHGFAKDKIFDFDYFHRQNGKNFGNMWGYPDSLVFDLLKQKLLKLQKNKNRFFILSETVNTHYPYEYLDKKCLSKYQDWRDVVMCSDKQVSNFINWFYQNKLDKNTILLIVSDHLSMDEEISEILNSQKIERKLLNVLIANKKTKQRHFSSLDIMPTVIEAADISSKSSKIGLGVSLFDETQKTLIERYGLDKLNEQLQKNSHVYESFL